MSVQSALFGGGLGLVEGMVSWPEAVCPCLKERVQRKEMPDFIFLTICPALALISHFVDQSLELLSGHWRRLPNYNSVLIALGGIFTHSSGLTALLCRAFPQGTPSGRQQAPAAPQQSSAPLLCLHLAPASPSFASIACIRLGNLSVFQLSTPD